MKKFIAVCFLVVVATFLSSCTNYCKKADQLRMEYKYDEAVKLYQKAADGGDAYAMWRLARAYGLGQGVEFNPEKALELLNKSSEKGCEEAIIDLGRAYIYGFYGNPVDTIKGVEMIKAVVADSKNPYVLVRYAFCFLNGKCFGKNDERAFEILESINDKENSFYLLTMGEVYLYGINGVEANSEKASVFLEKAFQKGEGNAAADLGSMFLIGNNSKKDINKGIEWLKKGVGIGDTECMYKLARVYNSTDSLYKNFNNPKEAHSLLEKAAKCGNAAACVDLGYWYLNEDNVENDDAKAFEYFKLADKYGSTEGSRQLGQCYWNGWGCDKNVKEGEKYWTKAALEGDAKAAYWLADGYADGTLMWNEEMYKKYIEQAASQGYGLALYFLGSNYYYGRYGYPKDRYRAFVYTKKGADLDSPECCNILSLFYKGGIGCKKDMAKSREYQEKYRSLSQK